MKTFFAFAIALVTSAHGIAAPATPLSSDGALQKVLDGAIASTLERFSTNNLSSNQVAVTLVDVRDNSRRSASYRGGVPIYPASVIKLFYLAAAHQWIAEGKLKDTAELRRAMRDMIVDSYNEATHYVVDALTQTTSGPELPESEMKIWSEKRNALNRYFAGLGYTNINANQKPWCEGPYGRERVWVGENYTNRNALTTEATAMLMSEIARGTFLSKTSCVEMLELLARDRKANSNAIDNQTHGFTAVGLPPDAKLWSKAGWTSTTRHDAAYVELADGRRFVLATFTTGHARNRNIIGAIVQQIVADEW